MSKKQKSKLCKHCKTEIPGDLKVCPNCNKKQGGMLKWIIIAVVVIGIGGILAENGAPIETENTVNETNTVEPTLEPTAAPTPEPTATPTPEPTAAPTPEPTAAPTPEPTAVPTPEPASVPVPDLATNTADPVDANDFTYVLNTSTQKIHHPNCKSVDKIKPENYATTDKSLEELLDEGYTKCGNCW